MKIFVLMISLFVFLLPSIFAESENDFTFSFQASPGIYLMDLISLGTIDNSEIFTIMLDLEFQYAINDYINISIVPQFNFDLYARYSDEDTYYAKYNRFTLTPGLLYRPFGTRLKGMYVGVYVPIGWSNNQQDGYRELIGWTTINGVVVNETYLVYPNINDNFFLIGTGLSAGYQWILKNGFTISLGAGGEKIWSIASDNNTGNYREVKNLFKLPFDIAYTFRLGYSF